MTSVRASFSVEIIVIQVGIVCLACNGYSGCERKVPPPSYFTLPVREGEPGSEEEVDAHGKRRKQAGGLSSDREFDAAQKAPSALADAKRVIMTSTKHALMAHSFSRLLRHGGAERRPQKARTEGGDESALQVAAADWEKKLDSMWQSRLRRSSNLIEDMLGGDKLEATANEALDPFARKIRDEKMLPKAHMIDRTQTLGSNLSTFF
ncbi:hypothetical protein AXG93_2782s1070 [Marchantia polymorpha subsp. ruderalis]|uniref:Uncharacterized protein n=1 Tax=Marchantia polymorpha subsp. ruderalis TaxID=1480154 RepID=A0A176WSK2_MARPO|nr:hypothetical protein AXG93_2782s1070 [Marchantia polymorpha subsp. ruderalis]